MLEFYGSSPTILVPRNPRVGVTKADRYEPELQRSYEEMAGHFGIAVIPARPPRARVPGHAGEAAAGETHGTVRTLAAPVRFDSGRPCRERLTTMHLT